MASWKDRPSLGIFWSNRYCPWTEHEPRERTEIRDKEGYLVAVEIDGKRIEYSGARWVKPWKKKPKMPLQTLDENDIEAQDLDGRTNFPSLMKWKGMK